MIQINHSKNFLFQSKPFFHQAIKLAQIFIKRFIPKKMISNDRGSLNLTVDFDEFGVQKDLIWLGFAGVASKRSHRH